MSASPNELEIGRLVGIWCQTIGPLHHKDRDCHFRISRHWKYDGELNYELEHCGYLLGDVCEEYKTQAEAECALIELLTRGIRDWIDHEDSNRSKAENQAILDQLNKGTIPVPSGDKNQGGS